MLLSQVYEFVDPPGYVHYVTLVIDSSHVSGIVINGALLDPFGKRSWSDIGGNSGLVTTAVQLPDSGAVRLEHQLGWSFGAYRYSYISGQCAFAYPAGAWFPPSVSRLVDE
jgi:hypothetical protein